jgi:hypothetical protein
MGVNLNYRKIASGVQIPSQMERFWLRGKLANWFPMFDSTIQPGLTMQGDFTAQGTLHIVALLGSVTGVADEIVILLPRGSATVQFYDAGKQLLFSSQPLNVENQLGNAQHPFWLRSPYVMEPNTHIKVQVQNLTTAAAVVQITAFGYQD